jgi:hypothetical protein
MARRRKDQTTQRSELPDHQHSTARNFKKPPPLLAWYLKGALVPKPGRALVFGAGFLREAEALISLDWKVDALETKASVERRRELYASFTRNPGCRTITRLAEGRSEYQVITVTHVLEFIERPKERVELLREMASRLTKRGHLLLSLRGWSDVLAAKSQTASGDGIVTGLGTWTRGYSTEEASDLVRLSGLSVVASPRTPRSKVPEQVRLVLGFQ